MFVPILLAFLLLAPAASAQEPEAVRLADEGRDAEALAAFRRIAAANPNDHAARVWIARLHERMGRPEVAEPVYRSVLLEDPANLDARLGVASTLLARNDAKEALEVLGTAEERAPQNATVLTLLGRAHRIEGRTARAIEYFERAAAVEPTDASRMRLATTRSTYLHRVEVRGFSEQYNGTTPDSRSGDVALNYRLTETWRIVARGQVQRKFGVSEQRGGGGAEWQWRPAIALRGHALLGPDNLVMPEGDYLGEIEYAYGPATWTAGLRYFDFTGAKTSVFSPAVHWVASERLAFGLRYAIAWSEANTRTATTSGNSLQLRGDYRMLRRLWVNAGYAAGVDDFDDFSIDRIGNFRANAVSGGARFDLSPQTAVLGGYQHQWRSGGVNMGRATVSIQQRF